MADPHCFNSKAVCYVARQSRLQMTSTQENALDESQSAVPEEAWSVAQLNTEIEAALNDAGDRFPTYVVGEIADVNPYGFATFFDLTDTDADAQISCLAWEHSIESFDHNLEAGVTAVVRAAVDYYPERGDTQLIVREYWPVGESQRVQDLEALRSTLDAEGAFAEAAKRPVPRYPRTLGVVTSPSGSAIEDFRETVNGRWPPSTIELCGASVQGENAVGELVDAIQQLEHNPSVEVIVVTRGGGADATLWCFNEEPVVRTIIDCTTPVVVAIGHEDDETLAEAVADRRAMTPTAAGTETTPNITTVQDNIATRERRIASAYTTLVEERLSGLADRIAAGVTSIEQRAKTRQASRQRLADIERRVTIAYETLVTTRLTELDRRIDDGVQAIEQAAVAEEASATAARERLNDIEARIAHAYTRTIDRQLQTVEQRIDTAYRDHEANARVEAGEREAKRLRLVVAGLVLLLILLTVAALLVLL